MSCPVGSTLPSPRESRKAELLKEWNTRKMQRLLAFVDSLSPEDAEILLEGYQEQLRAQVVA